MIKRTIIVKRMTNDESEKYYQDLKSVLRILIMKTIEIKKRETTQRTTLNASQIKTTGFS